MIRITERAVELSTIAFNVQFFDEDKPPNAVTPVTLKWTLTDADGEVINEREDIVPGEWTTEVDIVLTGDDLPVGDEDAVSLFVLVEATYNSNLGIGLNLNEQIRFYVDGVLALP